MSETVWISAAPGHPSNLRPFRHDIDERDPELSAPLADRVEFAEAIAADELPKVIFGAPDAEEKDYRLPDLFYAYGVWVVSSAAAAVLRQADLGESPLAPVAVLKRDKTTPVGGEWFCFSIANCKDALIPGESRNMRERYIRNGRKGWFLRADAKDEDVAVSTAALAGPDVWRDVNVGDAMFFSDTIVSGLKKAKATKGFFLSKCRVSDN